MSEIKESVEIDRPPEEVFAYLDDVERHGEWQHDIVGVERVTEGPLQRGHACERHGTFPAAIAA